MVGGGLSSVGSGSDTFDGGNCCGSGPCFVSFLALVELLSSSVGGLGCEFATFSGMGLGVFSVPLGKGLGGFFPFGWVLVWVGAAWHFFALSGQVVHLFWHLWCSVVLHFLFFSVSVRFLVAFCFSSFPPLFSS